ncbi:unnamed protein product [Timema podura]|uniref:Uncharacterized protein n=1 Tax=Timema podura TaxID=61482 RepID=A0ABN7PJV7_TIMPD|nr:unnamed protein product [Timema podura]
MNLTMAWKASYPSWSSANFPIVVANIDDSEEPDFQGLYNKSIVIEREGRKIGIVGYLLNSTHTIASTENLRFLGEVETVTHEVSVLKEQGADIIIALSHCGLQADKEVASVVPGLDYHRGRTFTHFALQRLDLGD